MQEIASHLTTIWLLFAAGLYLMKHLIADFIFQTGWMAQGKERADNWILPLATHSAAHGLLTLVIFAFLDSPHAWLGLVDFIVHFGIDRSKALASRSLRLHPAQPWFWWLLGLDQTLHHATDFYFAVVIASAHTI